MDAAELFAPKTGLKSQVAYWQVRKLRDLRVRQAQSGEQVTANEITNKMDQVRGRFGLGADGRGYDLIMKMFEAMDDVGHIPQEELFRLFPRKAQSE